MAIYKNQCPRCEAVNYYDNGDEFDLTKSDVESIICYQCGFWWLLPGAEEWTDLLASNRVIGQDGL